MVAMESMESTASKTFSIWGVADGAMSRFKIENRVVKSARGADRQGDDFKVRYCSHLVFDFLSHSIGGFVAFSIP